MAQPQREESLGDWLGEVVDRTVTSVEEIHRSIAEIPLDLMRQSGFFEQTAEDMSDLHERSIGVVYDLVRDINRQVTSLVSDLLWQRSFDPDLEAE